MKRVKISVKTVILSIIALIVIGIAGFVLMITPVTMETSVSQVDVKVTEQDATHIGVNAEILEISKEVKGFVVKALGPGNILGEKCYINCESEDVYFIYADNITGETIDLEFEDFMVGDQITVDVKKAENKYALTSRVQLLTQRK